MPMTVASPELLGRYLIDRLRHQRERAAAILTLRQRLLAQAPPRRVSAAELRLARRLRELREEAARAFGHIDVCARCAIGRPPPHGTYPGGFCCGGSTELIFADEELGALRLSGTLPGDLVPARGELAGCLFRGPRGCVLPPEHRACRCLRHLCYDLVCELQSRGDLGPVEDAAELIHSTFLEFAALRAERLDDQLLGLR